MELKDFDKEQLYKLKITYKDKIDIDDSIKFGIEIEFAGACLEDVKDTFNKKMNKVNIYDKYQRWIVKQDTTVETTKPAISREKFRYQNMDASWENPDQLIDLFEREEIIYGGELNTPILTNTEENWLDLKKACSYLRQMKDITISDKCSLHFHTDKSIFDNYIELLRFYKMWMLYEDIIYHFGYGLKKYPRSTTLVYAKPVNEILYEKIKNIDNDLDELKVLYFLGRHRKLGFSTYNIRSINPTEKNTYEDRNCNGTLYEPIIQNSFAFTTKLKLLCKDETFDWDYIDYLVNNFKPMDMSIFSRENINKALELSNMVYQSDIDKLKFMKQYLKVFTNEDIEEYESIEKKYRL